MSIPAIIAEKFPSEVKLDGARHVARGKVSELHFDGEELVVATVSDTEEYEVELEISGNKLSIDCDCMYFLDVDYCEHIWAVLLKCRQDNIYPEHVWQQVKQVTDIFDDDLDEFEEEDDFGERDVLRNSGNRILPFDSTWRTVFRANRMVDFHSNPSDKEESLFYYLHLPSVPMMDIRVEVMKRYRKKNGEWSVPKPLPGHFSSDDVNDEADRNVIALLSLDRYGFYGGDIELNDVQAKMIIPVIAAVGRLYVSVDCKNDFGPLTFDDTSCRLLSALDGPRDGTYALSCKAVRGEDQELSTDEIKFIWDGGLLFHGDSVSIIKGTRGVLNALIQVYLKGPFTIPVKDIDEFLGTHFSCNRQLPIALPESLGVETVKMAPVPCLSLLEPDPRDKVNGFIGRLQFDYNGNTVDYDAKSATLFNADERKAYELDHAFHERMIQRLKDESIPFQRTFFRKFPTVKIIRKKYLPLVASLLREGWRIEGEQGGFKKPGEISLNISSGIDWFELEGTCRYDDTVVPIPKILAAAKKKQDFITLSDGSIGLLPEEWLKKYFTIAAMGKTDTTSIRFTRSQTFLVDALLADQEDRVTCDETFQKIRSEVASFNGISPGEPLGQFRGTLRPYQKEGLGWFDFLIKFGLGGCLADDMGLGKTVQVLAQLQKMKYATETSEGSPSLIVVPRSLIYNWKEETVRFTPDLSVLDFSGVHRSDALPDLTRYDIVLVTYGTLRRDIVRLRDIDFLYVILDEAQVIKNAGTLTAKTTRLLKARYRLALSGTPVENHISDLWSIFEFLNPGMLGNATVFAGFKGEVEADSGTYELLRRILRPFILRRTKAQVATDLPARTEERIFCEMEKSQKKAYNELKKYYRSNLLKKVRDNGINRSKIMILEALLRLRQVACHPGLLKEETKTDDSVKLDTLLAQITELRQEGSKCLVFSQFTKMLTIIRRRLEALEIPYEYLDGRTNDRKARIERFQNDPDCGVFLISLKAGGVGLNLTAAEYVFIFDPWWNPAVEAQAIDRTHRIGQDRPVFAYRLICKDTVEEKVLELQDRKRELADKVISGDESLLRSISPEELRLLLT